MQLVVNRENHKDGNQLSSYCFTLRVSSKARFLNKRYSGHLERNEHKSVEVLHEDISCGIQLQHKWNKQHKYFMASVDVKNPQSNFDDLENSAPPEESNDELLDQAWDDHTVMADFGQTDFGQSDFGQR